MQKQEQLVSKKKKEKKTLLVLCPPHKAAISLAGGQAVPSVKHSSDSSPRYNPSAMRGKKYPHLIILHSEAWMQTSEPDLLGSSPDTDVTLYNSKQVTELSSTSVFP